MKKTLETFGGQRIAKALRGIALGAALCLGATAATAADNGRGLVPIGTGSTVHNHIPVHYNYNYSISQTIYLRSEINQSGNITSIQYYWNGGNPQHIETWDVYLAHTSRSSFGTSYDDWVTEGLQPAFSGAVEYPAGGAGWITLTLDTPFYYNNADNLVVTVIDTDHGWGGSAQWLTTGGYSQNRVLYSYRDTNPYLVEDLGSTWANQTEAVIPNIRLDIDPVQMTVDAALTSLLPETGTELGAHDIKATLKSQGTQTLTQATIYWSVDGVSQTPRQWSGVLSQGQTAEVTLQAGYAFDEPRDYAISATVAAEGDEYAGNNTITRTVNIFGPFALPYFEGFEAGFAEGQDIANSHYTQEEIGSNNASRWNLRNSVNSFFGGPRTGQCCMQLQYYSQAWLFFAVDFAQAGTYRMSLWAQDQDSIYFDESNAQISLAYGTGGSTTAISNIIAASQPVQLNAGWVEVAGEFDIAQPGVYYMGIYGQGMTNYLMVDDISIARVGSYGVTFNVMFGTSPVEGAQVAVGGQTAVTNAAGQAVAALAPGDYDFTVAAAGYHDFSGTVTVVDADVALAVELEPLPCEAPQNLTCTVDGGDVALAWEPGLPGSPAPYNVYRDGVAIATGVNTTTYTDANLPNGTYQYHVTAQCPAGETAPSNTAEVTMQILRAVFTVSNSAGQPVADAQIAVAGATLATNAQGQANIELADGTYPYTVAKEGYDEHQGEFTIDGADAQVDVVLQTTVVPPTQHTVTFAVADAQGQPLEGAAVEVAGQTLATDAQGQAIIELENGIYPYTVAKEGYHSQSGQATVNGADMQVDVTLQVVVPPAPTYTVTFAVRDTQGQPLAGAAVEVAGQALTTDAQGQAATELENGVYPYSVALAGYHSHQSGLSVNGEPKLVEVTLQPIASGVEAAAEGILRLFPNPAADVVNVEAPGQIGQVEVVSLLGQVVLRAQGQGNTAAIDVAGLPQGVYYVRISAQGGTATAKFVKE